VISATPARRIAGNDQDAQTDSQRFVLAEYCSAYARTAFEENYDRPIGAARVAMILGFQPSAHTIELKLRLAKVNV